MEALSLNMPDENDVAIYNSIESNNSSLQYDHGASRSMIGYQHK